MRIVGKAIGESIHVMRKNLGITASILLILTLGIGANTAVFTVIDTVLLRPLPFNEPHQLVDVWSTDEHNPNVKMRVSVPDFVDWSLQSRSLESLGGWFNYQFTLVGTGEPMRIKGVAVIGDLFAVLREAPMLGRTFRDGDDHMAVLSYGLWQRHFRSEPAVVGRSVTLNGEGYIVVGVMPPGFNFPVQPDPVDLWAIWDYSKVSLAQRRDARVLEVIGRLRSNVTLAQANAEMNVAAAALRQQYPGVDKDISVHLVPAADDLVGDHRRVLLILSAAAACVLLIACVNVANLLLAKAAGQQREIAVRAALGASRAHIVLRLLEESSLLSVAGGVLGIPAAILCLRVLLAFNPIYLPGAERIGVDWRVLGFTLLVSLITGVLFGLTPAWHSSKVDLMTALRDGGRIATGGRASHRLRGALVVVEIALALVLLTGATLLLNSFWRLRQVDPGFDSRNVLTFRVSLPFEKYDASRAAVFFQQLQSRLQSLPSVRAASTVFPLPLNGDPEFNNLDVALDTRLDIEVRPKPRNERPRADDRIVQPNYFRAMGIRLIRGRDFNDGDDINVPPIAIINETLARLYFPNEDPLDKRILLDSLLARDRSAPLRRIVGVVGDVKHRGLGTETRAEVYIPFAQRPFQELFAVVKADSDPYPLVDAIRKEVRALDPALPIYDIKTLSERIDTSVAQGRFNALLVSIFAVLALVLTTLGLQGVMANYVAERKTEIGIRMALGAQVRDVLQLVIGQGATLALIGLVIGLIGSFALTRLMTGLLFGIKASDPMTFALVTLLLSSVALLTCYIPARKATTVDPMIILRNN